MITLYNTKGKKVLCDLSQVSQLKDAGYTCEKALTSGKSKSKTKQTVKVGVNPNA